MDKVLFEITEECLETGMRGYPVGYCTTSEVDPKHGLSYVGQPIAKLAYKEPYEVIYLLYHGKEASKSELATFARELHKRAPCSPNLIKHIRLLPREGHPMKLFCAALLLCGMLEGTGDYKEDALNVIAKMPQIVATLINHHAGWGESAPSHPELGYIENFVHMLNVPAKNRALLAEVFKVFNVLHYDHDGGNLSTFTGKAVASGLEDMYGSLCAAMAALAGPRHGRANQDCLEFVQEVANNAGPSPTLSQIEGLIRERLHEKKLIFGFGHAVLRVEDPRATVFFEMADRLFPDHPLVKIAKLLRQAGTKVLSENPKISDPHVNIDVISGTVLTAAGFPYPEYYTVLFGMARVVGIARQIIYERCEAREGKGTPIVRPTYFFKMPN